jgi:hypothetical protein
MRKDFHKQLGLMFQIEIQATKALVEATQCEVQMQLKEVETRAERGAYQRTGAAKSPKFDGCCVPTPVQERCRAQLLDILGESHMLNCCPAGPDRQHSTWVTKGVTFDETLEVLEDSFEDSARWRISTRIFQCCQTAGPPCLPCTTQ